MNKYMDALDENDYKLLQELVDKAIPTKPFWNFPDFHICINCQNYVINEYTQRGVYLIGTNTLAPFEIKYCPNCGQALDWSTDEQ